MKIAITLGSPAIGGGTNVIFEHGGRMAEMGEDVYIVNERHIAPEEYSWHSKAQKLKFITYEEASKINFDVAIATWWMTVYKLREIPAKNYLYFVQSIESKFYKPEQRLLRMFAELTYTFNIGIITEATWIKKYLETNFDCKVELVLNGIRKDIYKKIPEEKKHDGLRILVEGPVDVDFKNVPKTIDLVKKSEADEIWLLTSSNIDSYPGVDKVFSRVDPSKCAKIYSSCDAIVKLSYVEGMFGPPLEMFHCGGTCIVYDVTGSEEYIVNNKNGYIVKTDDDEEVIKCINKLKDKKNLDRLKNGAIETAKKWDSWDKSSKNFHNAIIKLKDFKSPNQYMMQYKTELYCQIYYNIEHEKNSTGIRKYLGNTLRIRYPKIYKLYRKIIRK